MNTKAKRRYIFISHHHTDDEVVTKITYPLSQHGYEVSLINAKPADQRRLVKEDTIRRLLRMKISRAEHVLVYIGKDTHSRPWVNWEIEQANKQGKRIAGVYVRGCSQGNVFPAIETYASAIVSFIL
jgi:hypothetical protein